MVDGDTESGEIYRPSRATAKAVERRNQITIWDDVRETLDAIEQLGREEPSK